MAYSNVTPPKLPEYDSVAYPYYVLVYNYEKGSEDWYEAHLYYSGTAFSYDGSYVTNAGAVTKCVYDVSGGVWTDPATLASAPQITYGLTGSVYQRIYTNHDILDGEGNVWLAADSVTAVETAWAGLKSWLLGYALGLAGKPLPINARKITGYSYNGVVLPKLPEWDRETYPYACIYSVLGFAFLLITADNVVYLGEDNKTRFSTGTTGFSSMGGLAGASWEWGELSERTFTTEYSTNPIWWANFNVPAEDGTTYLAASEPTPVYE